MRFAKPLLALCLGAALLGGCARAALDTSGFALNDTTTVAASFEDTWQAVKSVLRERELVIDTRDKRGRFVAFDQKKSSLFRNSRTRYTIELGHISESETAVNIETLREIYGTTLLTSPDWHARPAKDDAEAKAILDALVAKLNGEDAAAEAEMPDAPVEPAGDTPAVEDASNV